MPQVFNLPAAAKGDPGATGPGYGGTSDTSLFIGYGGKTLATQPGMAWNAGVRVRLISAASATSDPPTNWMEGPIVSYDAGTGELEFAALLIAGADTFSDWLLSLAGEPGAAGNDGADGADGIFSAIASQAEAEAGTENTKGMTPLRTAEAIAALASGGGGGFAADPAFISGLELEWVDSVHLKVRSGSAYVEGDASAFALASDATMDLTGTLTSDTRYYVYGYSSSGSLAIEVSATAPAAPYRGNARSKTGDNTRRYLGSFLTTGGGYISNFRQQSNKVLFLTPAGVSPFRVLANGTSTSEATVDCSAAVPPTARIAILTIYNLSTTANANVQLGNSEDSATGGDGGIFSLPPANSAVNVLFPLDAGQNFTYWYDSAAPSGIGAYIDVMGYAEPR